MLLNIFVEDLLVLMKTPFIRGSYADYFQATLSDTINKISDIRNMVQHILESKTVVLNLFWAYFLKF